MMIIPAVDIKEGKYVRLTQGRKEEITVFGDDPVGIALSWQEKGAKRIHVVDLDGAFEGYPKNIKIIKDIAAKLDIPIELGGGIRSRDTAKELLHAGISEIVLGTKAYEDPKFFSYMCLDLPGKIIAGIDAKDGYVAVKGWTQQTSMKAVDFAREVQNRGAGKIIFTDISRDGMLSGPNLESLKEIVDAVTIPVIASGGVTTTDDIRNIYNVSPGRIFGIILGKALYSGALKFEDALKAAAAIRGDQNAC